MLETKFHKKERDASWKLLLPLDQINNLFLYTENKYIKNSLERNIVDVFDGVSMNNVFDAAVIDEVKGLDTLNKLLLELRTNWIILRNCSPVKRLIKNTDLKIISEYAGFPPGNSRLLIPVNNISEALFGLNFHNPGSKIAKVKLNILRMLCRIGCLKALKRESVVLLGRSDNEIHLNKYLSQILSERVKKTIFYNGSDLPHRKITLLVETENNKKFVVKIADTLEGKKAVNRESEALLFLQSTTIKDFVPNIIYTGKWGGCEIQIQSCLYNASTSGNSFQDGHVELLRKFKEINYHELSVKEILNNNNRLKQQVFNKMSVLLESNLSIKLPVHLTHGDFAPWNIKKSGKKLFVYDWEDIEYTSPGGIDIFHFIYRKALLIGPWPGCKCLLKTVSHAISDFYNINKIQLQLIIAICLVREYNLSKSERVIELINYYTRTKL